MKKVSSVRSGRIIAGIVILSALGTGLYVGMSLHPRGRASSASVSGTAQASGHAAKVAAPGNAAQKRVAPTLPKPPKPLAKLSIDSVSPQKVTLSWPSSGTNGDLKYDVYRQVGQTIKKIGITTKTSFTDTEVSPNEIYRYYILPTNTGGAQVPKIAATVGTPYTWAQIHSMKQNDVVKLKTYTSIFGALGGGYVEGTGFFLPGGYIATCWHVIRNEHYVIDVYPYMNGNNYNNSVWYHAKTVHIDKAHDLAILKITSKGSGNSTWPFNVPGTLSIGQSVHNGQAVGILGHPGGEALTMTSGHVTNQDMKYEKVTDIGTLHHMIAMNTPSVGGNSGSPVFNQYGNVVGILESGGLANGDLSYAVPSSVLTQWGFQQTRTGVNFISGISGKNLAYWQNQLSQ